MRAASAARPMVRTVATMEGPKSDPASFRRITPAEFVALCNRRAASKLPPVAVHNQVEITDSATVAAVGIESVQDRQAGVTTEMRKAVSGGPLLAALSMA